MIKLVIFDADNTLYDWNSFRAKYLEVLFELICDIVPEKSLAKSEIVEQGVDGKGRIIELFNKGEVIPDNVIIDMLRANAYVCEDPWFFYKYRDPDYNIDKVRDKLIEADKKAHAVALSHLAWSPGLDFTIDILKKQGIKLAIYTMAPFSNLFSRLKYLNLFEPFDKIYCNENPQCPDGYEDPGTNFEGMNIFDIHVLPPVNEKDVSQIERIGQDFDVSLKEIIMIDDDFSFVQRANDVVDTIWAEYGTYMNKVVRDTLSNYHEPPFRGARPHEHLINELLVKAEKKEGNIPFAARISSIGVIPHIISALGRPLE